MLALKTAPAAPAVSVATAKAFCRVTGSDDDALFAMMVESATATAEFITQRALINQTWVLSLENWPKNGEISLPKSPVSSLIAARYYNSSNQLQTVSTDDYYLYANDTEAIVCPGIDKSWPTALAARKNAIEIEFLCGYGASESSIPSPIRSWLLLRISTLNEFREEFMQGNLAKIPDTFVNGLLDPFTVTRYA